MLYVPYFLLTGPAMPFDIALGAKLIPRMYCQFSAVGAPSSPQEDFLTCSILHGQGDCFMYHSPPRPVAFSLLAVGKGGDTDSSRASSIFGYGCVTVWSWHGLYQFVACVGEGDDSNKVGRIDGRPERVGVGDAG